MKKHWKIILAGIVVVVALLALIIYRQNSRQNPKILTLDLRGATIELVRIEPGEFMMGSPDNEPGHDPSESPQHKVKIERAFYIGKYEITQGQWEAIMGSNQSAFKGNPLLPADDIGRIDAMKFCQTASYRTTRVVRLPSEAEWEYACRAGSTTAFSCGNELLPSAATFKPATGEKPKQTSPVGSHTPNAWGLYDMHGNVNEWCADVYQNTYKDAPTDGTAAGAAAAGAVAAAAGQKSVAGDVGGEISYVYRGGAWRNGADECRSAVRFASGDQTRSDTMGFRVVVEVRE